MKLFRYIALLWLGVAVAQAEPAFVTLDGDISLPLPEGWSVVDSASGFPYTIVPEYPDAELRVYRSDVAKADAVTSQSELKASVYDVVDNVILQLPGAEILSNTGFNKKGYCGYVVEFSTNDSTTGTALRHRFAGRIYRRPSGEQIMFTLWGKSSPDLYEKVAPAFKMMQAGFAYTGPHSDNVFGGDGPSRNWATLAPLLVVLGLLLILSLRRYRLRPNFAKPKLWRCICGTWNSEDEDMCRRCAYPKRPEPVR